MDSICHSAQGDLFDVQGRLRYHLPDAEKSRMFPTDPHFACSTVRSTVTAARVPDFRRNVAIRDGVCPVSGLEPLVCQAAHLVAHSKGDLVCHLYPPLN